MTRPLLTNGRAWVPAILVPLLVALLIAPGCLGTIKHKRCKLDFDGCTLRCEAICEREGSSTNDPYRGDDPGGIRDFNMECSDCVRDCHDKAGVCDKAEEDRFNRPLPGR